MPDEEQSPLDKKDTFGKSVRDYMKLGLSWNEEVSRFLKKSVRNHVDDSLMRLGDVKSYADTLALATQVTESVLVNLQGEGFLCLTPLSAEDEEVAAKNYDEWEENVAKYQEAAARPKATTTIGGQYL